MFKGLLLSISFIGQLFIAQSQTECFLKLEKAFSERGASPVPDAMHKNVVICFFNKERMGCYSGKVRVEGGKITSIFLQYSDDSYVLYDDPFLSALKKAPTINNGISEMIYSSKGEMFKVVFMDQLKQKTSGQFNLEGNHLNQSFCLFELEKFREIYSTTGCLHFVYDRYVQIANKNLIFTSLYEPEKWRFPLLSFNKITLI
jgi:hypothetical protein